jgi:protein-export membrane protein SecD
MSNSTNSQSSEQSKSFLRWFRAVVMVGLMGWLALTVYQNVVNDDAKQPFKLGLDLAGGSHLVYVADVEGAEPSDVPELMNVLRDVIERRINIFGVSEPIVQVESSSFVNENPIERLVIELPGVTNVDDAIAEIGRTPLLEFKLYDEGIASQQGELQNVDSLIESNSGTGSVAIDNVQIEGEEVSITDPFVDTGLTGRYLETAHLEFSNGMAGQLANEPLVSVKFTEEGSKLFADITRNHTGEKLGIFLDGELLSAPVINEAITGGTAVISGSFKIEEARELAENLSFGALPVPIKLQSTQTIGASLGTEILNNSIKAGVVGLVLIILFMVFWYRLPGVIAGLSLLSYVTIVLFLFQLIPVTLTAAGLAGFVLSLGMAVDANVLVFERMKEEFRSGASSHVAAEIGFSRAWSAIRDGNVTSLLSSILLFWFGTSMVKGFALVFGMGVVVSMFSALIITRTLIIALPNVRKTDSRFMGFLFDSGIQK